MNLPDRYNHYFFLGKNITINKFLQNELCIKDYIIYEEICSYDNIGKNTEQFPVNFEYLIKKNNYSTKGNATKNLKKLKKNIDYIVNQENTGGRPIDIIKLTYNGAIKFSVKCKNLKNSLISILSTVSDYNQFQSYILPLLWKHEQFKKIKNNANYLAKVINEKNLPIYKFGQSQTMDTRELTEYGDCIYIDVFEAHQPLHVERQIKQLTDVKNNKYEEEINGRKMTEMVLLNDDFTYEKLRKSVKHEVDEMNKIYLERNNLVENPISKLEILENEIKNLREEFSLLSTRVPIVLPNNEVDTIEKVENYLENIETYSDTLVYHEDVTEEPTLVEESKVIKTNSKFKILQLTLTEPKRILNIYDGVTGTFRSKNTTVSRSQLSRILKSDELQIYDNCYWKKIKHDEENLYENASTEEQEKYEQSRFKYPKDAVARINLRNTEILDIFDNQKVAFEILKSNDDSESRTSICNAINVYDWRYNPNHIPKTGDKHYNAKRTGKSYGSLWQKLNYCSKELIDQYIEKYGEPNFTYAPNGKLVYKFDLETKEFIKKYESITKVMEEHKHSWQTINKSIMGNQSLDGCMFSFNENIE